MNVAIAQDVLSSPEAFRFLTSVFWTFVDGRHRWTCSAQRKRPSLGATREELLSSAWFRAEGQGVQKAIREHIQAVREYPRPQVLVTSQASSEDTVALPARDAAHVLQQPLIVLVENAQSDGAFLYHLVATVGATRLRRVLGSVFDELVRSWCDGLGDGRWIELRHGGGADISAQVRLLARRMPHNFLVLADADYDAPGADLGGTARKIKCVFDSLGLEKERHVILSKREMENYIPHGAINGWNPAVLASQPAGWNHDFADLKLGKRFNHLWQVLVDPAMKPYLQERAWRERAGRHEDDIERVVSALIHFL